MIKQSRTIDDQKPYNLDEELDNLKRYQCKYWGSDIESFEKNILGTLGEASEHQHQWNLRHKECREYCTSMEEGKYITEYDGWCDAANAFEARLLMVERRSRYSESSPVGVGEAVIRPNSKKRALDFESFETSSLPKKKHLE
eukprot:gnl/TRDRNA2_/TRDRNA2_73962_c0_seq1.p2 gnl/TRDRNA2_/TRDRNA2_73962_c0~~gnl/TRDRNA2_/TRDRNA2_73962_c0_seq1.p2  ORF type:complete len:142 (+),score=23.27 gnl/TRDRNA2_/TRDRNA2_73962_c0_seq1:394-819(+)